MKLADLQAVVAGFAPVIREHVSREVEAALTKALADALRALPEPAAGRDGVDGRDGASVTLDDVLPVIERGLSESLGPALDARLPEIVERRVAEAVAAIPPAKDGEPGRDGKDGEPGAAGADGAAGKDGRDGEPGANGRDGRDGIDGRDAALIQPIEVIDAAKSYPRGTWALHAGGLVHATRATTPLGEGADIGRAGWQVAQDGIASIEIDDDGERGMALVVTRTSGVQTRHVKSFAVPLFRDVWRDDAVYTRGDLTMFGGTVWRSLKDDPVGKPGQSEDWKVFVRSGRDGRDREAVAPKK